MKDEKKTGLMDKIKDMLERTDGLDDYFDDEELEELDYSEQSKEEFSNTSRASESSAKILCDVENSKLHIGGNGAVTVVSCYPEELAEVYEALVKIFDDNGIINLDFSDVFSCNTDGEKVKMYKGFATGENCCEVAAQMIARNAINADSIILYIEVSKDVIFSEVETICSRVIEKCSGDPTVLWGVNFNENKTKTAKVTVLVFGERAL